MATASRLARRLPAFLSLLLLALLAVPLRAAESQIEFTQETLPNGLRVIYAPLHQAPVVQVRVAYHVGSKDETPDRQGFAHMFEHMMFRGSAHVAPEEHMKLINTVGGMTNAFTAFDQTVYHEIVPANQFSLALWLEADRMASFKVSDEIYKTERNVVAEEWRMRYQNAPYGAMWQDFVGRFFQQSHYQWMTIGNMKHLEAAQTPELQAFFNRYYVPNNAVLVIAGNLDVKATQALVRQYFAWIPRGADIIRTSPPEPPRTDTGQFTVKYRVPLARVLIGYPAPAYRSDDNYALDVLSTILSGGRTGRLDQGLVYGPNPSCVTTSAGSWGLEDPGTFFVFATLMQGKDPATVEKDLKSTIDGIRTSGVTAEELARAKVQARLSVIRNRETAASVAAALENEALLGGDPNRANTELAQIEKLTAADIQRVAQKYLDPQHALTMVIQPDPNAPPPTDQPPATQPGATSGGAAATAAAKPVQFPADYPTKPPLADTVPTATFEKGVASKEGSVQVIVMPDHRLPLVHWSLVLRRGSDSDAPEKTGLAGLTASLMRRGAGAYSFSQLNQDLESRGISIEVGDAGDHTRLAGSCMTEQLDHAFAMTRTILREPTFPADQFAQRQTQLLNQLRLSEESPDTVAGWELKTALYGSSPLGVHTTPQSVARITLDDLKAFYRDTYRPTNAILIISGDIDVPRGQELAKKLLADWSPGPLAPVDYTAPAAPARRTIILIDRPEGRQANVRLGLRAYDIHNDAKFAGALANQILSAGINARLEKYVRAQKGLAYGVYGVFQPGRHGGTFDGGTDTNPPTTADAITSMFEVFDGMRAADVTDAELAEAKLRVAGSMVMRMQTMQEQADYRLQTILNDYPIDYFDKYPARMAQVTKEQVRQVAQEYILPDRMVIVVVAPAAQVKEQLQRLGEVKVVPMPARREAAPPAATQPAVKPAA